MNNNIKNIMNRTIGELMCEKERLNEEINDIIYGDMEHSLNKNDLLEINKIKEQINYIYDLIGEIDGWWNHE